MKIFKNDRKIYINIDNVDTIIVNREKILYYTVGVDDSGKLIDSQKLYEDTKEFLKRFTIEEITEKFVDILFSWLMEHDFVSYKQVIHTLKTNLRRQIKDEEAK